jgi:NAD(P)-dependent dehydrogenase (short-subunit alcohol dehydrogenase family)
MTMTKTVLITGASSGLGKVASLRFCDHGWYVSVNVVANDNSGPAVATAESDALSDWYLRPFPGISWFGG